MNRIQISKKELKKAVKILNKVVPKRSTKPILEHVILEWETPNLTQIYATSWGQSIKLRLEAETEGQAKILVLFADLKTLSKGKGTDFVQIEFDGERALFIDNAIRTYKDVKDIEEYPESENFLSNFGPMPEDFISHFNMAVRYSAIEASRYAIGGVNFDSKGICGTDGKRLVFLKHDADWIDKPMILPANLAELLKIADKDYGLSGMQYLDTKDRISFVGDNVCIWSQLVEGTFPRYREVFPNESGYHPLRFNKEEMVSALKQLIPHSGPDEYKGMEIRINGQLNLKVRNDEGQYTEATLPGGYDHPSRGDNEFTLGIDPRYMLPAIQDFNESEMMIVFEDDETINDKPFLWNNSGSKLIVMPISGF